MKQLASRAGVAVAAFACGAVGVAGFNVGTAGGSPTASAPKPATFQMYANVDAEGDLGSNYDAKSAKLSGGAYVVTFTHPIGHCAAVVQSGRAGGPDPARFDTSVVKNDGNPKQFVVGFADNLEQADPTPFMLIVTCKT